MRFCQHATPTERENKLSDMLSKGFILAEESNITTGNFLGFYESDAEMQKRINIQPINIQELLKKIDSIKADTTALSTK